MTPDPARAPMTMSDTPERVWIHASGKLSVFVRDNASVAGDPNFVPFVPERPLRSALADAERERDEAQRARRSNGEFSGLCDHWCD